MELRTHDFVLRPLGPEHNDSDYAAWTSSLEYIRSTPDFRDGDWPDGNLSLERNLSDLIQHTADFAKRTGFTYTVLDVAESKVIGCVYIYPSKDPHHDVKVRSWVTAPYARLDDQLRREVAAWLAAAWPFLSIDYFRPS